MVEYTKEFIEKIMEDFKERMACGKDSYGYPIVELGKVLNSFLPVELPPCPVCGGDTTVLMDGLGTGESWRVICPDCDITFTEQYKEQEAIDSYLATPYCVMYLDYAMSAE